MPMVSAIAQPTPARHTTRLTPGRQAKPAPRQITWREFKSRYLRREDGYKYEWVNGTVEKTRRSMDKTQLFILRNLLDFFLLLKTKGTVSGQLISEPDLFFLANHRRPDVAWLTNEQIDRLAYESDDVPAFIIEVISTNDQMNLVHRKMQNYQAAGVQVVWHVFPVLGIVHVYAGERLEKMTVCSGDDVCSAAPALPAFAMPVGDILKKPAKPA